MLERTAAEAVETARRLVDLFETDEKRIQDLGRKAPMPLRVLRVLCRRPLANLNQISESAGISFPSASKGVELLEESGIVHELTGQQRNRVFAYSEYLEMFSEGTEP